MGGSVAEWGSKQRQHYKMKNVGQSLGYVKYPQYSVAPNGAIVRMKYSLHNGTLSVSAASGLTTATGAGWGQQVWTGNSVYDCNYTDTGAVQNAYEFSSSTGFTYYYSGIIVTGSKISIDAFSTSSAALPTSGDPRAPAGNAGFDLFTGLISYLIPCAGQPGSSYDPQDIGITASSGAWQKCEIMPYMQRRLMFPNTNGQIAPFSHIRYNNYMSTDKMLRAETPKQLAQNINGSNNPYQRWFWHWGVDNHCTSAATVYYDTEIIYYGILFDRKMNAGGALTTT